MLSVILSVFSSIIIESIRLIFSFLFIFYSKEASREGVWEQFTEGIYF